MYGWICVFRRIREHWIWKDKEPFDKRSAWIDLIMEVNHEDRKINFEGKIINIERGQTLTSIKKLSERWKWSRHKVSDFLEGLEKDMMIVHIKDTRATLISIVNYDVYQFPINSKDILSDISMGQKTDTNNNINKLLYKLINKYKEQMRDKKFSEKVLFMSKIKESSEYKSLSDEEQLKLFSELFRKD